ncbi:hypothetical protein GOC74_01590 [Halomicrobium mukohataei]|uniref:Uncharacterized protein n=1 Tax=Halomicrobium mukohataei TaxID=57705 RepID=A0A847UCI4_9EURY|nr:hypothetical protein [Halomicrobium mukohataei]NLV08631.1 hypothetical protein [Halomicrobium mukohataei]
MVSAVGPWLDTGEAAVLFAALALATLGTIALFLVACTAAWRRRTTTYLLVTAAIGLLVLRSLVGFGTALGAVAMPAHHIVEHTFDFLIALFVLGAAYAVGE